MRVVTEGSKIEFPNQDPFNHNVFSKASQGPFDTDSYGKGKTKDNVFKSAGVYPIYCNVHPRMTAFVIAVKTPYFTQAGTDGRFSIDKVPAGKYTIHVWHDRGGEQTTDLTVPASGWRVSSTSSTRAATSTCSTRTSSERTTRLNGDIY